MKRLRRVRKRIALWWRYGRRGIPAWMVPLLEHVRKTGPLVVTSHYRTTNEQRELLLRSNHYPPDRSNHDFGH